MEVSSFTLIGRYQYSSEAFIYKGKLESNGVEVFIRDNNTIDSNPLYSNAIGGIKLFVKNEDVDKAKEVLSEISAFSLDDNNQLIQCQKCGEKQIDMVTSITSIKTFLAFLFSVLIVLIPFYSKHKYKCQICKYEFN
jgi:hypothetical protein